MGIGHLRHRSPGHRVRVGPSRRVDGHSYRHSKPARGRADHPSKRAPTGASCGVGRPTGGRPLRTSLRPPPCQSLRAEDTTTAALARFLAERRPPTVFQILPRLFRRGQGESSHLREGPAPRPPSSDEARTLQCAEGRGVLPAALSRAASAVSYLSERVRARPTSWTRTCHDPAAHFPPVSAPYWRA